ncbi:MAG: hypothetical protein J6S67_21560 [Methanobrevibacter sp.]|nr:hypothetical protein [Methanobrevibacter sp.]
MYPSNGLQTALNAMREMSVDNGSIYHKYVPVVTESTTIGEFGQPILDSANVNVLNDFVGLLKKVVATAVYNKTFNNPLANLEGERMPLGQFIEDVYVNPAKARGFNVNDFAGLLQKYEAEMATQYLTVNSDLQYCVTITREKIRNAFTSWSNLESLITGMVNSLYNGAYITRYNQAKGLVLSAYSGNNVKVQTVSAVSDASTAKALVKSMRATFSKMQIPSTRYNAWNQVKGGNLALKTWSDPEDVIVMISADVEANLDVEVLASAFNMSKADFLGRVIVVDDFSQYDEDGSVAVDGSAIQAIICDKAWFKIKTQDFAMDEFYNANNRTWQYYLNDVRMTNYSLFANAVVFATSAPSVPATDIDASVASATVEVGEKKKILFDLTPANATSEVTVTSSATSKATATIVGRYVEIEGKQAGSSTITISANGHSDTISVTVTAVSE